MTTTLENLDILADWLRENVCSKVEYKKPDDNKNDQSYEHTMVHPDVHVLYIPTKDILPIGRFAAPSILVQFDNEKTFPKKGNGLTNFKLGFSVWNPGLHTQNHYERNAEGFRDVWNFVQYTKEALMNEEFIGPIRIRLEDGIECGPAKEQGIIADFYPYWFAYLTFTGEFGETVIHKKYSDLL